MFGHLKAEDFVNLMDGGTVTANRRTHLKSCAQCTATLTSTQAVQTRVMAMSDMDENLPEPDWAEFRASVRDGLLSRSVQRTTSARRWMGWMGWDGLSGISMRPAMAWSLSIVFAIVLTAGVFTWNRHGERTAVVTQIAQTETPADASIESTPGDQDIAVWSQNDLFDEVAQLKDDEAQNLQLLLKNAVAEISVQK